MSFIEWILGIEQKTPEQIALEIEESNERNYVYHTVEMISEANKFKDEKGRRVTK